MERIILRQSEEILCEGCWKGDGYPPFCVESGSQDQNAEEVEEDSSNEEDEVDHSYRFTSFSTPSSLLSTSFNQQIQETQASSPLALSRPPQTDRTPSLNLGVGPGPHHEVDVLEHDTAEQSTQGDILYTDLLIKYLTKRKDKGDKEQLKWIGNLKELQDFVALVLKLTGTWKQSKVGGRQKADQPPALKHTFHDKKTTVTINWLSSSKTLNLQGPQDPLRKIKPSHQILRKIKSSHQKKK